ncbi:MAG: alpha/beta hydrolase [Chitinophagaceae bacterium]|jgi:acetyl esterase/lipase|nr:alpha/beta hydrolase [Chitinophagaceae bacterium]
MKKIFFIASLFLAFHLSAQTDTAVKKVVKIPKGYEAKIDEVYSVIGDWKGMEDIYFNPTSKEPTPIIFNIHGGGWKNGTKDSQGGFNAFFKMGFAVGNIGYRLTGKATAPAAIEDVRGAILYVVKHAKELNVNPHKIVIMGGSAGGHLALMAGLLQNDNKFDGDYKKVKDYTIVAIIDKYGIVDVWDWAYGIHKTSSSATQWLGDKAKDEVFAKSVSPIYYVKKTSPPTLIIHGDSDPTVPYEQSVALKKKFDEVGATSQFITVPGGLHGKFTKEQNDDLFKQMENFLKGINIFK